jgi:hypothetical protein
MGLGAIAGRLGYALGKSAMGEPTSFDDLRDELKLGHTYASLARAAGADTRRRETNRTAAEQSYDLVSRAFRRVKLTPAQADHIVAGLGYLRQAIASIPQT